MTPFSKLKETTGKAFLFFLIFLLLLAGVGYVVYNNKDFQRSHRKEVAKINFYIRDYKKAMNDFIKDLEPKIAEWKKSLPFLPKDPKAEKPLENRTFEELIMDPRTLEQEVPAEMIRHQPDEITICSLNADFLLNNPLSDKEMIHLGNILRFCELSTITNIQNENFLKRIKTILKLLRYNATYDISPASVSKTNKSCYAFLYRDDKVQPLQKGKLFNTVDTATGTPYYGTFKTDDFDFTIVTFATPASGIPLDSTLPLENIYETLKTENTDIQDIMMFGDFAFESRALIWDSASLLPTIARTLPPNQAPNDLLGNFWFRKKDLVEFNNKSGIINIKEEAFTSKRKLPVAANKPLWVQFKVMPDDD